MVGKRDICNASQLRIRTHGEPDSVHAQTWRAEDSDDVLFRHKTAQHINNARLLRCLFV